MHSAGTRPVDHYIKSSPATNMAYIELAYKHAFLAILQLSILVIPAKGIQLAFFFTNMRQM